MFVGSPVMELSIVNICGSYYNKFTQNNFSKDKKHSNLSKNPKDEVFHENNKRSLKSPKLKQQWKND